MLSDTAIRALKPGPRPIKKSDGGGLFILVTPVIPSGCSTGICGTCKVRKNDGEVHMVHNGGIKEEDVAKGFILACYSRPLGRVSIDA